MTSHLIALLAAIALAGCQARTVSTTPVTTDKSAAESVQTAPASNGARDLAVGERRGIGELTAVEDGGYPMYVVTIVFQPGQPGFELTANAEDLGLGAGGLEALKGKRVAVGYTREDEPDLRDIQLKGASVLGDEAPASVSGLLKISGRLSGAGEVSGGDLPDTVTVTPAGGKPMTFEAFVSEGMTRADGREVTVFYETRPRNRITSLKAN